MEKYKYEMLISDDTPNGVYWFRASSRERMGFDVLVALNRLGLEGWEMTGALDVAAKPRMEIFLKKKIT